MLFDNGFTHVKTDARTAFGMFGTNVRLENALNRFHFDSAAVIDDANTNATVDALKRNANMRIVDRTFE